MTITAEIKRSGHTRIAYKYFDFKPWSDKNKIQNIIYVIKILSETDKITSDLLKSLGEQYKVEFEVISLPRFGWFPPISEKIKLFSFSGKIFL